MDETLIHCLTKEEEETCVGDVAIKMDFTEGFSLVSQIIVRPYALEILNALKPKAEIIVFTASERDYAQPILDYLDP